MNSVAILVVTYNRKDMLVENINAILNQSYREFDYYVIDQGKVYGTYCFYINEAGQTEVWNNEE